ncbi:MAG: restriction endonuclease subunit S [Gammaproteobacteria bacterium]|nr:restriction endonuclease subunit S [Gammaproteobacteria bacterium]
MRTVLLQEICDLQIGKTPSRSVPAYWGGQLPWVTISDFSAGRFVTTTKERITQLGAAKSGSKCIPRGTLLLSFKLSLGKRTISGCDVFTNEAIAALHILDHNAADRDYLYWALGSIDYDRLVDRAAKGKTLNKAKLKVLRIPLPPLAEQKRIAGILDAADALRAKRREALAQLDTLIQSTFLDMFGDPVTNPMGWKERSLGELAQGGFRNGLSPSTKGTFDGEVLTLSAITRGRFDFAARRDARFDKRPSLSQKLNIGTFLICRGNGNRNLVGTGTYPDRSSNRVCFPDTMIGVTIDPATLTAAYLQRVWRTRGVRRQIERGARTTNGTHKVNQRLLSSIVFPVPPADLQLHFAAIVESIEKQGAIQRAHLAELDNLFASLQSRAFRGDL